jgi:hypothetical protein
MGSLLRVFVAGLFVTVSLNFLLGLVPFTLFNIGFFGLCFNYIVNIIGKIIGFYVGRFGGSC